MRSSLVAVVGLMVAGSVVADVHRHADFHDIAKRDAASNSSSTAASSSCSCTTYTTTVTGQFVLVAPSSTSSSSSSSSSASSSSSSSVSSSSVPPSTTTTATPSSSSTSQTPQSSAPVIKAASAPSSSGGKAMAMAYSPYSDDRNCKTADMVDSDLKAISQKGFSAVRVYSTDCSGLPNIGNAARKYGLKMIIGIFIGGSGIGGASSQVDDIAKWAQWDLVTMVVVGNEAIFNKYCSASDLAGFISSVRKTLAGSGYTGPVTTTEPLGTYQDGGNGGTICAAVDVMGANLHPFFNPTTDSSGAGAELTRQIKGVEELCPDKQLFVLETGWPSQGSSNGAAQPGQSQQQQALTGIISAAGARAVILAYTNDMWKDPGPYGVEQYFGCLTSSVW